MREVSFKYPTATRQLIYGLLNVIYTNRVPVNFCNGYIAFGIYPHDWWFTKQEILAAYYLVRKKRWETEVSTYLLHVYISAVQWEMEEDKQWK